MNGATAEPLVNMTKPPKSTIMAIIGSSQYFFRTFMKATSSDMNDISVSPSGRSGKKI